MRPRRCSSSRTGARATCCAATSSAVGLPGARLDRRPVAAYLADPGEPADRDLHLVFADPPYDRPEAELAAVLAALTHPGRLAAGALVVVERAARSPQPAWPEGIAPVARRRYGDAVLWYGRANHD